MALGSFPTPWKVIPYRSHQQGCFPLVFPWLPLQGGRKQGMSWVDQLELRHRPFAKTISRPLRLLASLLQARSLVPARQQPQLHASPSLVGRGASRAPGRWHRKAAREASENSGRAGKRRMPLSARRGPGGSRQAAARPRRASNQTSPAKPRAPRPQKSLLTSGPTCKTRVTAAAVLQMRGWSISVATASVSLLQKKTFAESRPHAPQAAGAASARASSEQPSVWLVQRTSRAKR